MFWISAVKAQERCTNSWQGVVKERGRTHHCSVASDLKSDQFAGYSLGRDQRCVNTPCVLSCRQPGIMGACWHTTGCWPRQQLASFLAHICTCASTGSTSTMMRPSLHCASQTTRASPACTSPLLATFIYMAWPRTRHASLPCHLPCVS